MKYASDYYAGLHTFSNAPSNMNRLCKDLEKWSKTQHYTLSDKDFDWRIMIDESLPVDEGKQEQINNIYLEFCKEMSALAYDQSHIRKYGDESLSKFDSRNFTINWGYYYDRYREECQKICPNANELANMAVRACYEFYPQKKNSKFMWRIAGEGIVKNIKQQTFQLPIRDDNGEYEYLGKKYRFDDIQL